MVEVDAVSNEFYLRRVAWSYLKHPDGNNSQCEEEGVEQQGEAAELSSALAFGIF